MMNRDRFLTKSRMKIGLECPMKLSFYDDKNQYNSLQGDTEFLDFLAEGGYQVGELAKFYYKFHFPNFHEFSNSCDRADICNVNTNTVILYIESQKISYY